MVDLRVARRYASALFQVALKSDSLDAVADDLENLRRLMEQSNEFRAFLYSPLVARDRKKSQLRQLLSTELQVSTLRLLDLLIDKRREKLFLAICEEFQRLQEAHQGVVRALIVSAVELTETEQQALVRKLETGLGKRLIPTYDVRPEILGGVIVQMGDYQIDGSLQGALNRLHEHVRLEIARRGATRTE